MIKPKPYKYICPECKYKKVVKPKSDVIHPKDLSSTCPKCFTKMDRKELNVMDEIFNILRR